MMPQNLTHIIPSKTIYSAAEKILQVKLISSESFLQLTCAHFSAKAIHVPATFSDTSGLTATSQESKQWNS